MNTISLKGEGESQIIRRTKVRIKCDQCGEPANFKHTYLLPNARSNPASSAYRKDDCSWCSDHEEFTCANCSKPGVAGYAWCSTFTVSDRFAHMFLKWEEVELIEKLKD
jgi:hypothetical protein